MAVTEIGEVVGTGWTGIASGGSGSVATVTVGAGVPAGSLVVIEYGSSASSTEATVTSITDTKGNTYAVKASRYVSNIQQAFIAAAVITTALDATGTADTITITMGNARTRRRVRVRAYSGATADVSGTVQSVSGSGTSIATTIPDATIGDLLVTLAQDVSQSATQSWSTGWTDNSAGEGHQSAVGTGDILTRSGWRVADAASVATTVTLSASAQYLGLTVGFAAAAASKQYSRPASNGEGADTVTIVGGSASAWQAVSDSNPATGTATPNGPTNHYQWYPTNSLPTPASTSSGVRFGLVLAVGGGATSYSAQPVVRNTTTGTITNVGSAITSGISTDTAAPSTHMVDVPAATAAGLAWGTGWQLGVKWTVS